jgi:hypothetical protein
VVADDRPRCGPFVSATPLWTPSALRDSLVARTESALSATPDPSLPSYGLPQRPLRAATRAPLGRLEQVALRDYWAQEHTEFTPWLAAPDNLKLLGDAIGRELEPQGQEVGVGPFRADILCRDLATDQLVLVENQVEQTDHVHLGQILTYVAGLKAKTIVWIAREFREEHRAALDWLNENTSDEIEFYGVQIELWRIGVSPPAPRFLVVAHPNEWTRDVRERVRAPTDLTPAQAGRAAFWAALADHLRRSGSRRRPPRDGGSAFREWPVGASAFKLVVAAPPTHGVVRVQLVLYGPSRRERFSALRRDGAALERELAMSLDWRELPEKKESKVRVEHPCDFADPSGWEPALAWVATTLDAFDRVFRPRVQELSRVDSASDPVD